jgi:tRNA G37 N-methylase TrmD
MKFKIFTLHPDIFTSFVSNSLIARAIFKQIIEIKTIDWRQDFGIGNYKQVDDKPFGGGSGMVLMADPIIKAMISENCFDSEKLKVNSEKEINTNKKAEEGNSPLEGWQASPDGVDKSDATNYPVASQQPLDRGNKPNKLFKPEEGNSPLWRGGSEADGVVKIEKLQSPHPASPRGEEQIKILPNNANFYQKIKSGQLVSQKVNILMTPRGFPMTQQIVEWLSEDFEQINILCGRYEGFDARINDHIDLELSIGDFVLNGGEVGAMCLVETVSRLVPDFITKNTSVLHDSFSSGLNNYKEFEFDNSKPQYQRELEKSKNSEKLRVKSEKLVKTLIKDFGSNSIPLVKDKVQQGFLATYCPRGGSEADGVFLSSDNSISTNNADTVVAATKQSSLFNNAHWLQNILPRIEHPQYTRPNIWLDPITNEQKKVPEVLLEGNHARIQRWRAKWW